MNMPVKPINKQIIQRLHKICNKEKKKTIIGMIHLKELIGQENYSSEKELIKKALEDLESLQKNGVDGAIVENWEDNTPGEFISDEQRDQILRICKKVKDKSKILLGINVLPNDYRSAYYIAEKLGLDFVQLDVCVDHVKTNYTHSKTKPFEIIVDLDDLKKYKTKIPLMASIKPKHYTMLDNQSFEESYKKAIENSVDIVVVTGEFTGISPDLNNLKKIYKKEIPIFIGSGLNKDNCAKLLEYADGAIVGTAFKDKNFDKIISEKVKELINKIKHKN